MGALKELIELLVININTGMQSINTEIVFLTITGVGQEFRPERENLFGTKPAKIHLSLQNAKFVCLLP